MSVPPHIEKPPYVHPGWVNKSPQTMEDALKLPIEYKTDQEILLMKETCSIARDILEYAGSLVQVRSGPCRPQLPQPLRPIGPTC